jgi:hypothetical protein
MGSTSSRISDLEQEGFSFPERKPITQLTPEEFHSLEEGEQGFRQITDSILSLLEYKNRQYGGSSLDPINVFSGKTKVGQRADDKVSRIKNSDVLRKNDVVDLIGYLILMCKENSWTNFDEFKD